MGILVFHVPNNRFTRFGSMLCQSQNIISHLLMQMGILSTNRYIFFTQDAPGSHGELHHRHQGVYLTGAYNQLFIKLRKQFFKIIICLPLQITKNLKSKRIPLCKFRHLNSLTWRNVKYRTITCSNCRNAKWFQKNFWSTI